MPIKDALLPEFDLEMASTRRVLERVPEDKLDWKPHPKSMSLGRLATHLAELPGWVASIVVLDEFDIAPAAGKAHTAVTLTSPAEILALFDETTKKARAAIESRTDAQYMEPWSFKKGGVVMFSMPRVGVVRNLLLSHMIHHRGQMSVYLRLNDVALPPLYGPTADERF